MFQHLCVYSSLELSREAGRFVVYFPPRLSQSLFLGLTLSIHVLGYLTLFRTEAGAATQG